jgi:ring-1,2-phenylacetyl-CoA epoxidase subunit PaaC
MIMDSNIETALVDYLTGLGDDELILGHRDSEWCGHAPIIEEDIAFANLALDEIGHAQVFYRLVSELLGENPNTYPDRLVFQRPAADFKSLAIVELPNRDWAFSLLRQYLFDAAETIRLSALRKSTFKPLAHSAEKIYREEVYHLRHTSAWIKRLGLGTPESRRRMQKALEELWPYTGGLFHYEPDQDRLLLDGTIPDAGLDKKWMDMVTPMLNECRLVIPRSRRDENSRRQHSPYLDLMIADMQSVVQLDPEAHW